MSASLWKRHFRRGLSGARHQPGLSIGLYALSLVFSALIVLPLGLALERATEYAALPLDLRAVDAVTWWSLLQATAERTGLTVLLAFVLVPVHGLVRAVALTGMAAALCPGSASGFWVGVGRWGWRGLLVALFFAFAALLALAALVLLSGVLGLVFEGEVGIFWTQLVLVPALCVTALAVLDLMHEYARAALVVEDAAPGKAIRAGLRFPPRHGAAVRLYLVWFVLGLGLWLLPFAIDAGLRSASVAGIAVLFALQQAALFARSAVSVGWVGSSVGLYAEAREDERFLRLAAETDGAAEPDTFDTPRT